MRRTGRDEIGGNRSAGGAFHFFFLHTLVDKLAFLRAAAAAALIPSRVSAAPVAPLTMAVQTGHFVKSQAHSGNHLLNAAPLRR